MSLSPARAGELSGSSWRFAAISFERGRRDVPRVALTFDGGSAAGDTERILGVLESTGVPATFFLTGAFITAYPELVLRIARGGHAVANHTWSHPHLTEWERLHRHDTLRGVNRRFLQRELAATADAYRKLTGRPMLPLWRAPYGEVNGELLVWAADGGWTHVGWTRAGDGRTLDSLDWVADRASSHYLDSAGLAARILSFGSTEDGLNGGIVLMHLCTRRDDPLVGQLGNIIRTLGGRGYRFATVPELLGDSPPLLGGDAGRPTALLPR